MRTAIISDIHSNLEALTAVLDDMDRRDVNKVLCLGDCVGYGSQPNECLELLLQRCSLIVAGNHDAAAAGTIDTARFSKVASVSVDFTRRALRKCILEKIAEFPYEAVDDGLLLVHAAPHRPDTFPYVRELTDAKKQFLGREFRVALYGHTHVPMTFQRANGKITLSVKPFVQFEQEHSYLCNVGSVGQPRDQDPRASYSVFDAEHRTLTTHRVLYDVEKTRAKIEKVGLPSVLSQRLLVGV